MSVDLLVETYYLTPKGWTTQPVIDELTGDVATDALVEVWDLDVYWAHGWDEEHHHWTCMWVTPDAAWNMETRNALRQKYPFPAFTMGVRCVVSMGIPLLENRVDHYGEMLAA